MRGPTPLPTHPPRSEAKLKAVKVDKADVDMLAEQFDLTKPVAERQLRLAGGDVHAALRALIGVVPPAASG